MTTATLNHSFSFSQHAIQRMADMALGPDDAEMIRAAMTNPRSVRPAGANKEYRTRGKITLLVATDLDVPVIVSVLWARMSDWAEDQATIQSRGFERSQDTNHRTREQIRRRKAHDHRSRRG